MNLLPLLILITLTAALIEYVLTKVKINYEGIIPLISTLTVTMLSIYATANSTPKFSIPWISRWAINYSLALNGISDVFVISLSFIFLMITILCLNRSKHRSYWPMLLITQALVFNFILAQDLVIKVLSWEFIWIPIFIMMVNTDKAHCSKKFSKIWYLTGSLLIMATVIMVGKFSQLYDVAFWIFITATITRCYFVTESKLDTAPSLITKVILPLLPIIFLISTILPMFPDHIKANTISVAIVICIYTFILILKLVMSRSIQMISYSNILIFSGLMFTWLMEPNVKIIQLSLQIIIAKTFINILMVYYGDNTANNINKWVFILVLIMSFGFAGPIIGIPMLQVLSLWDTTNREITIAILALIFLLLVVTAIKTSALFSIRQKALPQKNNWLDLTKLVIVCILFIGIIWAAVDPSYISKQVEHYHTNNIQRGQQ